MMETILNLGVTDEVVRRAAKSELRFLLDAYRRLIQMFGEVVGGIEPEPSARSSCGSNRLTGRMQMPTT